MSQSEIEDITANWKCQWCPHKKEAHKQGEVEAGVGSISNDSFKHGKYTGLDKQGNYFVGNASYEYKDNDSNYADVELLDIGLDSRQLEVEGGLQGKYDLDLQYTMLPGLNSDTARSPYRGKENQRLPGGWVQSPTTAGMTELANSLRDVDIYTERKTIDVGASYYASSTVSYDLNFQQQTRQGRKAMGLALGDSFITTRSAILAVPVDTSTKQGGVKMNYRAQRWQGSIGYAFSIFGNAHDQVLWDNAYSVPATAAEGQAALEPDNEMQQITLDGVYLFSEHMQATVALAVGRMTQNADFLPYTVNGALAPPSLPRSSLDGKVNTYNTTMRLNSRWDESWNYSLQYRQNEQANDTPRATYDYVLTDAALSATARTNFPYSFRKRELLLQGRYQIDKQRQISLDYERDTDDRTYQEVKTTSENSLSASYRSNVNDQLQWSLRLKSSIREGDKYTPVSEITPPENTLLRKYNLADNKSNLAAISFSYSISDELQFSAFVDHANDDYSDSDIGLQESRQSTYLLELQYIVSESLSMNFDYNVTKIKSSQAGASWDAENDDSIKIAHFGLSYEFIKNKLLLGTDLSYADARGDIIVSTGSGFPGLNSTRKTFMLFADYTLDEKSMIRAFFGYEDYEEDDWTISGVVPNSLDNALTLGDVSPSYNIGMFAISYKTQF